VVGSRQVKNIDFLTNPRSASHIQACRPRSHTASTAARRRTNPLAREGGSSRWVHFYWGDAR
jgi:hypothetical protein